MSHPESTDDAFLGGRLRLLQPARGYRAAIDPVLLAAACGAAPGERAVDLGCGVGTALLCLAARVPGLRLVGVEAHPATAALAQRNVERNGFGEAARVVCGDVADPALLAGEQAAFDRAIMNPPYLPPGRGTTPPNEAKAMAHIESTADLAAFVACAARLLRVGGSLTAIHRADRAQEFAGLLAPAFGEVSLRALAPRAGAAPRRVLIGAVRGAPSGDRPWERPPFVLHEADGSYTAAAQRVLRDAAALDADDRFTKPSPGSP